MALEIELETYHRKLSELLEDSGKFVLIHGNEVNGIFVAYEDAIKEGYEKFGLEPFLVKKIEDQEEVQFITRFTQCPTSPVS